MPDHELGPDANDDPGGTPEAPTPRRPGRARWLIRVVLIGYIIFLLVFAWATYRTEPAIQLDDLLDLRPWLGRIVIAGLLAATGFLVLGFLVAIAVGRPPTAARSFGVLGRWLSVLLGGVGLLALISLAGSGRVPHATTSLLPMTGYLVGTWIGFTCLRGRRATWWLVPKLGLLLTALVAGTLGLVLLAIDQDGLSFQPPRVTSGEKRRLAEVLQGSRPAGGGLSRLRLSQRDINLLVTMAMAQALPQGKARIALDEGTVGGDLSVPVADPSAPPRYLNLQARCRAGMEDGELQIGLQECRVGQIPVPRFLLRSVSRLLVSAIVDDADLQSVVATIDSVRVEPGGVEVVFRSGELDDKVIPSLVARLGQKPDVLARTRVYYRRLVSRAEVLPEDDRFRGFLRAAFQLARERSQSEDPVVENRAAILALAILLGHWRVESLVGPVTDEDLRLAARRRVGRVTLRGRRDWRQHFLVSAALALLSNESVSDEVGLFKEELDAGEGGSGFSFSDLLADRAGTLWALAATRDEASARRMQDRLAGDFKIDEVFPPAADLPEGISDRELQAEYGGVGGGKYHEVIQEIERRLATCAALK